MANDVRDRLTKYLTDAHSLEEQALQQLRQAPEIAGTPEFARELREHLTVTEVHERRVRDLLRARGAAPSPLKDVPMRAGGTGFILFARSQTDTPGKLAAHALSFEALEWASYELLARTAERAAEPEVAQTAREIRDDERTMMGKIEALFDRTVDASLRDVSPDHLRDKLKRYLADAHAIEAQSIQLLESARGRLKDPTLARIFEHHLAESREQQHLIEQRLQAIGGKPSWLKDAAMRFGGLNWGMFFRVHPDTPGKLAAFAYAFEHLEIGGYEQLRRVAQRAEDEGTAEIGERILTQERKAAEKLADAFDEAVSAAIGEHAAD